MLDSTLFDYTDEISIIVNDAILTQEYIPQKLIGRDTQKKKIAKLMKPLFRNGSPDNCLILGPTGCGKTVVSKFVLRSLITRLAETPVHVTVDWVYIPCKKIPSTSAILYALLTHLQPDTKIPRTGYSLNYYYDALFSALKKSNTGLIVILDEIDFLKSDDVLYNFSRAVSNDELGMNQFIKVIGLSNSIKFEETLDQRVLSSMGFDVIRFPAYGADEIYDILNERVTLALTTGSVSEDTLFRCATRSAKENGDVRKALKVLKAAAALVEGAGERIILPLHVDTAWDKVEQDEVIATVLELPLHHKIILLSVVKLMTCNRVVTTGQVTDMYEKICKLIYEKPGHRTTVSKSIGSLEMQSFLHSSTVNLGRKGGITRMISIKGEEIDDMKAALYEDYNLEELESYTPGSETFI